MTKEFQALSRNVIWHVKLLPQSRKAISCKWVFSLKRDAEGHILRYKAMLVARSDIQKPGTDFQETFAPVARMTSQRLIIAITTLKGLTLYTLNIDNAYLNGVIDTKLYMKQPKGFEDPTYPVDKDWVCELAKRLYRLKQAGNIWNEAIHTYILEMGFTKTDADLYVYVKQQDGAA